MAPARRSRRTKVPKTRKSQDATTAMSETAPGGEEGAQPLDTNEASSAEAPTLVTNEASYAGAAVSRPGGNIDEEDQMEIDNTLHTEGAAPVVKLEDNDSLEIHSGTPAVEEGAVIVPFSPATRTRLQGMAQSALVEIGAIRAAAAANQQEAVGHDLGVDENVQHISDEGLGTKNKSLEKNNKTLGSGNKGSDNNDNGADDNGKRKCVNDDGQNVLDSDKEFEESHRRYVEFLIKQRQERAAQRALAADTKKTPVADGSHGAAVRQSGPPFLHPRDPSATPAVTMNAGMQQGHQQQAMSGFYTHGYQGPPFEQGVQRGFYPQMSPLQSGSVFSSAVAERNTTIQAERQTVDRDRHWRTVMNSPETQNLNKDRTVQQQDTKSGLGIHSTVSEVTAFPQPTSASGSIDDAQFRAEMQEAEEELDRQIAAYSQGERSAPKTSSRNVHHQVDPAGWEEFLAANPKSTLKPQRNAPSPPTARGYASKQRYYNEQTGGDTMMRGSERRSQREREPILGRGWENEGHTREREPILGRGWENKGHTRERERALEQDWDYYHGRNSSRYEKTDRRAAEDDSQHKFPSNENYRSAPVSKSFYEYRQESDRSVEKKLLGSHRKGYYSALERPSHPRLHEHDENFYRTSTGRTTASAGESSSSSHDRHRRQSYESGGWNKNRAEQPFDWRANRIDAHDEQRRRSHESRMTYFERHHAEQSSTRHQVEPRFGLPELGRGRLELPELGRGRHRPSGSTSSGKHGRESSTRKRVKPMRSPPPDNNDSRAPAENYRRGSRKYY